MGFNTKVVQKLFKSSSTLFKIGLVLFVMIIPFNTQAELTIRPDRDVLESTYKPLESQFVWIENNNFAICDYCPSREPLRVKERKPVLSVKVTEPILDTLPGGLKTSNKEQSEAVTSLDGKATVAEGDTLGQGNPESTITIYFDFDSARIRPSELPKLAGIKGKVKISGYTCDIGPENYNLRLSTKRALAVEKILRRNPEIEILDVHGYGECCPKETRPLSRRVEIEIYR
jgi:outer membrane protein OmpA-like peptidoglycan-associated protein